MMGNPAAATVPLPLRIGAMVRFGLVQAALGAVVVLVTSTLNRIMVVEYRLPAVLPGLLVALHYAVQMVRPRFGHGSDRGGRRTPWIIGGMAVLSSGGIVCAAATVMLGEHGLAALGLAVAGYVMVGLGVGAAGTSLLVLMAKRVDARRRAAAATIMWVLMIAGFAVTSTIAGHFLDPFSPQRLLRVMTCTAVIAFVVAVAAIWKVESGAARANRATAAGAGPGVQGGSFSAALRTAWADPPTRGFTLFVFVSMLAYSAQELLLEPFCGLVFGFSAGDSARVSGAWHGAALAGMIFIGIVGSGARRFGSLRSWTIVGCIASAAALLALAASGALGLAWPLRASVIGLGAANGAFAVSAIGSMMELAHAGDARMAGVRMGLWGAAQAVAFAAGGLIGTAVVDACRWLSGSTTLAFAIVFCIEALLFCAAAGLAARVNSNLQRLPAHNQTAVIA